jgi:fluoroacetyl-CoA thioesterase
MSAAPSVGLRHSQTIRVTPEITVPRLPAILGDASAMPPVLATAHMVAFIEMTCVEGLRPHLAEGQASVGTMVHVTHLAATPIGMAVTAEVELVAVEGRKLRFRVACRDEKDLIGEGFHERFVIDVAKFMSKLAGKS